MEANGKRFVSDSLWSMVRLLRGQAETKGDNVTLSGPLWPGVEVPVRAK